MNEKDRCDVLLKLADFRMTRVAGRREHEWKVTVALWALLAAGIVKPPPVPKEYTGVVVARPHPHRLGPCVSMDI
jgi:hypothetical protein